MHNILEYNREVYRKLIHISSSSIPISIFLFGKINVLPWLIFFALLFPLLDYIRRYALFLKKIYYYLFGFVTRKHEENAFSGATWVFIGSAVTLLLFDEKIAIISLLIMSLADSAAAIIGIKFGKTKLFNKSLEGSCAFFLVSASILLIITDINYINIFFIAFISTLSELLISVRLNDNLYIPIITGLLLSILI